MDMVLGGKNDNVSKPFPQEVQTTCVWVDGPPWQWHKIHKKKPTKFWQKTADLVKWGIPYLNVNYAKEVLVLNVACNWAESPVNHISCKSNQEELSLIHLQFGTFIFIPYLQGLLEKKQ